MIGQQIKKTNCIWNEEIALCTYMCKRNEHLHFVCCLMRCCCVVWYGVVPLFFHSPKIFSLLIWLGDALHICKHNQFIYSSFLNCVIIWHLDCLLSIYLPFVDYKLPVVVIKMKFNFNYTYIFYVKTNILFEEEKSIGKLINWNEER